jgi:hypothetical protein
MESKNGSSFHRKDLEDRKADSKARPGAAFGPRTGRIAFGLFAVFEVLAVRSSQVSASQEKCPTALP